MDKDTIKPNKVIVIPSSEGMDFFRWWCVFLRPIVGLTTKELEILASLLRQRWKLSEYITDPRLLDTMLLSDSIKTQIFQECHISKARFNVALSAFKKRGIITNGIINPKVIPNINKDNTGTFKALLLFKDDQIKNVK